MKKLNITLLRKWCKMMLVDKGGLWYKVLMTKYGEEEGRLKEGAKD